MGVRGIGIDIVKVPRIEDLVDKWGRKFLDRVFTESELQYCSTNRRRNEHLAGRFAAKEAVIKAVGVKIPWKSIDVKLKESGRPFVLIDAEVKSVPPPAKENLHISITHLESYALAIAVLDT